MSLIWHEFTSKSCTFEDRGGNILKEEAVALTYGYRLTDYLENLGENRTIVSAVFILIAVFYWIRRQHFFFIISALACLYMAVTDFEINWRHFHDCPGAWVWCAGCLLLVLSAFAAFMHESDSEEHDEGII